MKFIGIEKFIDNKILKLFTINNNMKKNETSYPIQKYEYNIHTEELFQNTNLVLKGKIYAINNDYPFKIKIIKNENS